MLHLEYKKFIEEALTDKDKEIKQWKELYNAGIEVVAELTGENKRLVSELEALKRKLK